MSELSRSLSASGLTVATEVTVIESVQFDAIDLLILSASVPLADAVCASACGCWSDAADLWFLISENSRYRLIATECGFEAAVLAGEFELAEYFHVHNRHLADTGVSTEPRWIELVGLKARRKRLFLRTIEKTRIQRRPPSIAELVELRLFKRAIHRIFVDGSHRRIHDASARLLAKCYSGLGYHASLIALQACHPRALATPDLKKRCEEAWLLETMRTKAASEIFAHFLNVHPAGAKLSALLEWDDFPRSLGDRQV